MDKPKYPGVKIFNSKGRTYAYHRETGVRLKEEIGSPAFVAELAAIERSKVEPPKPVNKTLGRLLEAYQQSRRFTELAPSTRETYRHVLKLIEPLHTLPLVHFTPVFVAKTRDVLALKSGARSAAHVMAVLSVAASEGVEKGLIPTNPVAGVSRPKRDKRLPKANRPWTAGERKAAIEKLPPHVALVVALAMHTGLRMGDCLTLERSAIKDGMLTRRTGKTGQEVFLPVHPRLAALLAAAPKHEATTLLANSYGKAWTIDGFKTSFGRAMDKLAEEGRIALDLTFHGLRHTVGTMLRAATDDIDLIRRWLGQATLSMATHYSRHADISDRMRDAMSRFDPLGPAI